LNRTSVEGIGCVTEATGSINKLVHVLAVGKNCLVTGENIRDGLSLNPKMGSSSSPVTNCNILGRVMFPLRPPKPKENYI